MARQLFSSEGAPCLKCHMTGDPKHDARATAPNFTVAKERLKPGWTKRWMLDPAMMTPGTAMPSGLFRAGGRPLGVRRSHAGEFQGLSEGSRRFAGTVHVPVHAGRAEPPALQRRRSRKPEDRVILTQSRRCTRGQGFVLRVSCPFKTLRRQLTK